MIQDNLPALSSESSEHARKISEDIHARLRDLAQQIAAVNKHDNIQCSDVNKALLTIKQAGMEDPPSHPPWYSRPSFNVGLGSMLFGAAPSVAGFSQTVIDQAAHKYLFAILVLVIPALLAGVGATLAVIGWVHNGD